MAFGEYYVDPDAGDDTTGDGTIGTPWQTVQHALDTISQGSNGDRINVKAGTDDVLGAALSFATYGSPAESKPLYIQGYTSTSQDGGIGGISGGGSYGICSSSANGIIFKDMHLHNCGANTILNLTGGYCQVIGCEIDNNTSGYGVYFNNASIIAGCYLHNLGGTAMIRGSIQAIAYRNYMHNGDTNYCGIMISCNGLIAVGNILVQNKASTSDIYGIFTDFRGIALENTIVCTTTPGSNNVGIRTNASQFFANNYIAGFSGSGNVGMGDMGSVNHFTTAIHNAAYNNTTNYKTMRVDDDNDALGAAGIVGSGDYSPTGVEMIEQAWPQSWPGLSTSTAPLPDKGAVQLGAGAGGGGLAAGIFGGSTVR